VRWEKRSRRCPNNATQSFVRWIFLSPEFDGLLTTSPA
jgi:hypothetical protein